MFYFSQIDTQAHSIFKKTARLIGVAAFLTFVSFTVQGHFTSSSLFSILTKPSDDLSVASPAQENQLVALTPQIELSVTELIFSASDQAYPGASDPVLAEHTSETKVVTVQNLGDTDLNISSADIIGAAYSLTSSHSFPEILEAGQSQDFEVTFAPGAGNLGLLDGTITFESDDAVNPSLVVNLYGISTGGFGGNSEPPLSQVVEALGYDINVGWTGLTQLSFPFDGSDEAYENGLINMSPTLIGEEVDVQVFQKAGNSTVTLTPVARYSPIEGLPTGWYTNDNGTPTLNQTFVLSAQAPEHQSLLPEIESGSIQFDPGTSEFGIYITSAYFGRSSFTEDALNTPSDPPSTAPGTGSQHRVRTYPIKDRQGNPVPNQYLICFEDANNGDYQDYVYVLSGVEPGDTPPPIVTTRINVNGADYTDAQGNVWLADNYSTGGLGGTKSFGVAGTDEDDLFLSYRFADDGAPFSYNIPVADNGSYIVKLLMIEPFFGAPGGGSGGAGSRVFSVDIEGGQGALSNYDISADVGSGTAAIKTFSGVMVTDGVLNIDFTSVTNNAIISAIEISGPQPAGLFFEQNNNNTASLSLGTSSILNNTILSNDATTNLDITVNALDAVTLDPISWLTINGSPLNNYAFTTDTNFDFELNTAGLSAGTYTAYITAVASGYEPATFELTLTVTPPQVDDAFFSGPNPANGSLGVPVNGFQITVLVNTPVDYELTASSLAGNVNLYEVVGGSEVLVPASSNDTGGGDAITLTPTSALNTSTTYRLRLVGVEANRVGDVNDRIVFQDFVSSFTTADTNTGGGATLPGVSFTKVSGAALGAGVNDYFTSLEVGPDGKLYGSTTAGQIKRWSINADGTLSNLEVLSPALTASPNPETGVTDSNPRLIIGFTFDKDATASNLIAYVTHSAAVLTDGPNWDGKITQLSGANLGTVKDVVINLPRSTKDHLTNSIVRGPDGALYISQGSNTAGGDPDAAWGNRIESLLAGTVMKLDLTKLPEAQWPLNAYTTSDIAVINNASTTSTTMSDGTYNPYANNSPLTIYSAGIRNAYDLVWHSNGTLYAPTNGTAGNNTTSPNTPATNDYLIPANGNRVRRTDGTFYEYPGFPNVPAVRGGESQKDWLFKLTQGSFHGHPNPYQGYFVLNHGGASYNGLPGQTSAHIDVAKYPSTVTADPAYVEPAYDFGFNKSPNGAIEYKSNAFGGALQNKLLVVRFSGQNDIMVLEPDNVTGDIVETYTGVAGFGGFIDPLELIEDTNTGNIYVAQYDRSAGVNQQLILLRADEQADDAPEIAVENTLRISNPITDVNPSVQNLLISNQGELDLEITNIALTGTKASKFSLPNGQVTFTIPANSSINLPVAFNATDAADLGTNLAELVITSNHLGNVGFNTTINLRGLGTAGYGGSNEPSLQAILDVYNFPINVGDDNASTSVLHGSIQDGSLLGEEVSIQKFEKSSTAPVEIEVLAVYGPTPTNPAVNLGWYESGDVASEQLLLSVANTPTNNTQNINPVSTGSTSFDLDLNTAFGFYTEWPFFSNRKVYSEDILNTFSGAIPHHVRVYPMKNTAGQIVPNQYIVAFEENTTGFDYQDIVLLVKNVKPYVAPALPPIVFTPDTHEVTVEVGSNTNIWALLSVPGATSADLTFTAVDNATGLEPTWLSLRNASWEDTFTFDPVVPALTFDVNSDALTFGEYEATVTVEAEGYAAGEMSVRLSVVPLINWTYNINFQQDGNVVPAGFISDTGLGFQTQTKNGQTYNFGWISPTDGTPKDNTASARFRTISGVSQEIKTLNQLQRTNLQSNWANWAIDVPNDNYYVEVVSGDTYYDSHHKIGIEGVEVLNYPQISTIPPTTSQQSTLGFAKAIAEINVADGTLNIAPIDDNGNAKISYIRIGTPGLADVRLGFTSNSINETALFESGINTWNTTLTATAGSPSNIALTVLSGSTWLSVPATASLGDITLTADVSNLAVGLYKGRIRASLPGYQSAILDVNLEVLPQGLEFDKPQILFAVNQGGATTAQNATINAAGGSAVIELAKTSGTPWLILPASPVDGVAQSYNIDASGLAPGIHTAKVMANASGYTQAEMTVLLKVSAVPSGTWDYKINFQKDPSPIPSGYIPDLGDAFGTRSFGGNTYEFGWIDPVDLTPKDNTAQARRRGGVIEELRTLNHMQFSVTERANWEMSLPNGTYDVLISVGETQFFNSHHTIRVEGRYFMDFNHQVWNQNTNLVVQRTVEVTDGKLTVDGQAGENTKIQYIWVRPTNPLNDNIPPSIEVTFDGVELEQDVYKNQVVVRALPSDQGGSGIVSTEFSLDNGVSWQPYTNSLIVDEQGFYSTTFRTTDGNGNSVQTPVYNFRVEQVPLNNTKMVLENRDKFPENDELSFHRIQEEGWRQSGGGTPEYHDFVTLRVNNRGSENLRIFNLILSNPDYWQIETINGLPFTFNDLPFDIESNQFLDIGLRFTALNPPNPRSNGIKVLHETLTIISNDDEMPNKEVKLHGLWQREGEGGNEPMASEILEAFGLTIDIAFPSPNFKDGDDFSVAGDEIYTNNFVRADEDKPVYIRQLAAFHGCCGSGDRSFTQDNNPEANGGRIGNKGGQRTSHIGADSQTILPRKDNTGPVGTLGDPAEGTFTPNGNFNVTLNNDSTNPLLNWPNTNTTFNDGNPSNDIPKVGVRIWKLRNSKGDIVPYAFVMANDVLFAGANFDYNDNLFLLTNVRPEFGTGYASLLATGNGIENDPAEKQSDLDFGQTAINAASTQTLNLRSLGQTFSGDDDPDIEISFVEIVGQNRGEFFADLPNQTTLRPSEATTMQVHFNPLEFGAKHATLLIHYNSEDSPMRLPLYGIATSACNDLVLSRKIKAAADDANPVIIAGETWESDEPFRVSGINYKIDRFPNVKVALTDRDELYNQYMSSQGSQNGRRIEYAIPLDNGDYTVRIHFAEIYWQDINSRVNDILIEGQTVIEGFDAFNEIGEKSVIVKDFQVTVTDGILDLRFNPIVDRPSVAGIEIFQFDDANPITLQLVNSTNADCSQTNGTIEVAAIGNTNPVMYKLGKFGNYQTSPIFTGLLPGEYTIYVKEDVPNACESEATFNIAENPSAITFDINLTGVSCEGGDNGAAELQNIVGGVAPYRVFWNGSPIQGTIILENLSAGDYSVEVIDANNCAVTQNFTIESEADCPSLVRIQVGHTLAFTDDNGNVFMADNYFSTPSNDSNSGENVTNTSNDRLYQRQRWRNGDFNYTVPVTNGMYQVILHFAEMYEPAGVIGGRIFNVDIENERKLTDFDVFAEAGGLYLAITREFIVDVQDGFVNIDFLQGTIQNPMVSAIEIIPYEAPVNVPPIVNQAIPNQTVNQGEEYNYQISNFAFIDGDDPVLSLSATLSNGDPLPTWLTFTPATRRFTGTPSVSDIGDITILVVATDSQGQAISQEFTLGVRGQVTVQVAQNTRALIAGTEDKVILSIQVTATAGQALEQVTLSTDGTSNLSDILRAKLYQADSPSLIGGQLLSFIDNPSGEFTITGLNYTLQEGMNQFWLTYDVADNATESSLLDAELTQVSLDGVTYAVSTGAPAGARMVRTTDRMPGKVLDLDGVDDYATLSGEEYFDFESQFSIELWLKVNVFDKNNQAIITKGNTAWRLQRFGTTDQVQFVINGVDNVVSTSAVNDGKWHHIAATYSGTQMTIYVDGRPEGQKSVTGTPTLNNFPVWVGANAEVPNLNFNGQIDEVSIWKEACVQSQIRENRHLTLQGNETGLLTYLQFNESVGVLAADLVDGFVATLTNTNVTAPRIASSAPVGGGVSFRTSSQANSLVAFGQTGLNINFGANHPAGEIVITKIIGLTPSGDDPAPGKGKTPDYWVINNYGSDTGLSPMEFVFTLDSQFMLSVNPSDYTLYKRGANDFEAWTSNFEANTINGNDITFGGITGFSQVIIAGDGVSLPVRLLSFEGRRLDDNRAQLTWSTASEENNVGFEIQKSQNATDFTTIAFVEGAGNSIEVLNYAYIDDNASESAYYRLKQLDSNGDSAFSNIVYIRAESDEATISIYPNPYDGFLPLNIKASAEIESQGKITMQILDMKGQLITEVQEELHELQNILTQRLQKATAGQYLVRFFTKDKNYVIKIIRK